MSDLADSSWWIAVRAYAKKFGNSSAELPVSELKVGAAEVSTLAADLDSGNPRAQLLAAQIWHETVHLGEGDYDEERWNRAFAYANCAAQLAKAQSDSSSRIAADSVIMWLQTLKAAGGTPRRRYH
jgi:hypothetical protein